MEGAQKGWKNPAMHYLNAGNAMVNGINAAAGQLASDRRFTGLASMMTKGATGLIDGWAGSNAATLDMTSWGKAGPLGALQKYDNDVQAQNEGQYARANDPKEGTGEGATSKGWG